MTIEVRVPQLSESVVDATLIAWHKQPGQRVQRDERLAELETDKVVLEIAAPADGVLREVRAHGGATVRSGELLAVIDERSESRGWGPDGSAGGAGGRPRLIDEAAEAPEASVASPEPRAAAPPAATGPERRVAMSRLRRRIAARMVEASSTQALVTTVNEVDLTVVQELRARYNARFERAAGKLGVMPFFVKASVEALQQFPIVNARIDGDDIVYHNYHDLGIAVSTDRGVMVPVVRRADRKGLRELEQDIAALAARARSAELTLEELAGGTFTITNGGVFGSLLSTPIVHAPQSAILGMHKVQDRPIAMNGAVVVRPMMYLALSYDHRLIDGHDAVQFLVAVKDCLEDPRRLLAVSSSTNGVEVT